MESLQEDSYAFRLQPIHDPTSLGWINIEFGADSRVRFDDSDCAEVDLTAEAQDRFVIGPTTSPRSWRPGYHVFDQKLRCHSL
jgi:hypothetical protein